MGNRGHIVIHSEYSDTPVVLYTHWGADRLPEQLASALAKEARWSDPSYLSRIIFDQITADANETTGAGIQTTVQGDAWRVIDVDTEDWTASFREGNGYSTDEHANESYDFQEFVEVFTE